MIWTDIAGIVVVAECYKHEKWRKFSLVALIQWALHHIIQAGKQCRK